MEQKQEKLKRRYSVFKSQESDKSTKTSNPVTGQYAYTSQELQELQEWAAESENIQKNLQVVYKREKEIALRTIAIKNINDPELKDLLSAKLNQTGDHDISCSINRDEGLVYIKIKNCDKSYELNHVIV